MHTKRDVMQVSSSAYTSRLNVSNAFDIQFRCDAAEPAFCSKAERAFASAAKRIASEFDFRRVVTVDLAMFLPCNTTTPADDCPDLDTLGYAMPANRMLVRHNDDNITYSYPTALFKQTDLDDDSIDYRGPDILARFNAVKNWRFPGDPVGNSDNVDDARDLDLVATHEFMHGLGFGDDFAMSNKYYAQQNKLLPYFDSDPSYLPVLITDADPTYNGDVFYRFTPPSIWDKYVTYTTPANVDPSLGMAPFSNGSIMSVFSQFNDTLNRLFPAATLHSGVASDQVVEALLLYPRMSSLSDMLYSIATTADSLSFTTAVGEPFLLETSLQPFLDGSSVVHSRSIQPGEDFLMVWETGGQPFSSQIAQQHAPASGIGPGIRNVMTTLGYRAKGASMSSVPSLRGVAELVGNPPRKQCSPAQDTAPVATAQSLSSSGASLCSPSIPLTLVALAFTFIAHFHHPIL
ncbi:hypothetical protein RI367_003669 [Sorochytrium milnesiophthora]